MPIETRMSNAPNLHTVAALDGRSHQNEKHDGDTHKTCYDQTKDGLHCEDVDLAQATENFGVASRQWNECTAQNAIARARASSNKC